MCHSRLTLLPKTVDCYATRSDQKGSSRLLRFDFSLCSCQPFCGKEKVVQQSSIQREDQFRTSSDPTQRGWRANTTGSSKPHSSWRREGGNCNCGNNRPWILFLLLWRTKPKKCSHQKRSRIEHTKELSRSQVEMEQIQFLAPPEGWAISQHLCTQDLGVGGGRSSQWLHQELDFQWNKGTVRVWIHLFPHWQSVGCQ